MMQKIIPNFLVCGSPKCASTSLNFYLEQHSEIYMSPVKQTKFFSVAYHKGTDSYIKTFFPGVNEKVAREATENLLKADLSEGAISIDDILIQ